LKSSLVAPKKEFVYYAVKVATIQNKVWMNSAGGTFVVFVACINKNAQIRFQIFAELTI